MIPLPSPKIKKYQMFNLYPLKINLLKLNLQLPQIPLVNHLIPLLNLRHRLFRKFPYRKIFKTFPSKIQAFKIQLLNNFNNYNINNKKWRTNT